jgi:PAS domain-containing protein
VAIVAITDVTGKIVQANDNFVRISKYSREGSSARSPTDSPASIQGSSVTAGDHRRGKSGEMRSDRAKDSSLYWVDTTISPTRDTANRSVHIRAFRHHRA